MRMMWLLIRQDLGRQWRTGGLWLPVIFFLLVATLFPFAVGPDSRLLAQTGAGIVWVAALLATLLRVDQIFSADMENGTLDQLVLRGLAEEIIATARLVSHAIGFAVPLLIACFPAAALLHIPAAIMGPLLASLLLAAPGLSALTVITGALLLQQRASYALAGLLMFPLAVPLLIFGAGATGQAGAGALPFLGAVSLLLVAIAPFAAGAALRAARSG
jgi:heme exporter protein B